MAYSLQQGADRVAIRKLIDHYAHCADRRKTEGQMALFTENTHFVVFMEGEGTAASQELHSKEELRPVFEALKAYSHTMHFNGQSTLEFSEDGQTATGETYCIAHHVTENAGQRQLMVAHLRYHDIVRKGVDGGWLFAERKLYLDWAETRPLN
ncbi:hypothetical protein NQ176_g2079 [Zarea fungicola]|uniref:Uncharacterized protein n=1 Tax=Zarea fungicola TaxID=93591 RepID=A0ACC1NR06_9HYPO|nr:hypothetical protein NQ176_g2079 [Lecanicillium fungicola]